VPIPAFFCEACGRERLDERTFAAVRALFAKGGANAWFTTEAREILPKDYRCPCGGTSFRKEEDIFDVWFESAASHRGVCMKNAELKFPPELYLEGTDQHRGWFQVSLLASLLSNGQAPFKHVVTHGFLTDARTGDKLSKSGFLISADEVSAKYGSDLLRLWIASIDFTDDIPFSKEILQGRAEPYFKIRNTFRFLLGNLHDFDPERDAVRDGAALVEIDRWAIANLQGVAADVTRHYENYEFFRAYHRLYDFCVVDLSAVYFDVLKDRLYCGSREGRRSAQTALCTLLLGLVKLYAPILAHTCEEVWGHLPGRKEAESVHLSRWPSLPPPDTELLDKYARLFRARDEVNRRLEKLRGEKAIGKSLEARVELHSADPALQAALASADLDALFIVSEAKLSAAPVGTEGDLKGLTVRVEKSPHPKCERCWALRPSVGRESAHPALCARCIGALAAR
jgi:isoleucyl-tRNA synthetase